MAKLKWRKCNICDNTVRWEWGYKPKRCPHCDAVHYDKPPMEAKLFNFQEKFLREDRNPDVIGQMFPHLKEYARRIVLKNLAGKARYDEFKLEEKSADTANKLVEYYLGKPTFEITQSFGYYLDKIAKQNMFAKRIKDQDQFEFSMDEYVETHEDNSNAIDSLEFEAEERSERWHNQIEGQLDVDNIIEESSRFIAKMIDMIRENHGNRMAMMQFLLLIHFIQHQPKSFFNRFYKLKGQEYKEVFEKVKMAFEGYMQSLAERDR